MVHASRGQSGELAAASGKFSDDFDEFLDAGLEMAGQTQVRIVSNTTVSYCSIQKNRLSLLNIYLKTM